MSKTQFGESDIGMVSKDRGDDVNPDQASSSGSGFLHDQGDGKEQLKDVGGAGGASSPRSQSGDSDLQNAAIQSFITNLPLVMEYYIDDTKSGEDDPVLKALDELLEEAFPGYRDDLSLDEVKEEADEEGETAEHELIEKAVGDLDDDPEESEEDDSKEEDEDDTQANEAKDGKEPNFKDSFWHVLATGEDPKFNPEPLEPEVVEENPYLSEDTPGIVAAGEDWEEAVKWVENLAQSLVAAQDGSPAPDRMTAEEIIDSEWGLNPGAWPNKEEMDSLVDFFLEAWMSAADDSPSDLVVPEQFDAPAPKNPHDAAAPAMQPVADQPVGPSAPGAITNAPTCPVCGQSHIVGTPCPTAANQSQPDEVQQQPLGPPQPQKVVTKTHTAEFDDGMLPGDRIPFKHLGPEFDQVDTRHRKFERGDRVQITQAHGEFPAGTQGVIENSMNAGFNGMVYSIRTDDGRYISTVPAGEVAPTNYFEGAGPDPVNDNTSSGETIPREWTASADDVTSDTDVDEGVVEHDAGDWADTEGKPLKIGHKYNLISEDYAIPDQITVEEITPTKLTFIIDAGDMQYSDELTRDDLDTMGYTFEAITKHKHKHEDKVEAPEETVAPDLEVVDPDPRMASYHGSFASDQPNSRDWLMNDGGVEVDPKLAAKLAGKHFSPSEQREFIDEQGEARNLSSLQLEGTHYIIDKEVEDSLW